MRRAEQNPRPTRSIKDVFLGAIAMGTSLALLAHFALIRVYGEYLAREPNLIVWSVEVAALVGFVIFSARWLRGNI